jgi:hypothetical protein
LADEHGNGEYWMTAMAHIAQAKVLQQGGRLDDAATAAVRGIELARRGNIPMDLAYGLLTLAQVRHERGDPEEARELLRQTQDTVDGCPDPGLLSGMVEAVSRRFFVPTADGRHTQPA